MARIKLNMAGFRELRNSPKVVADLTRRAEAVAASAGPGHKVDVNRGRDRARAAVITDTIDAAIDEAQDRNLTRAIDAATR